jgi:PPM family protein phosphatase
MSQTQRPDIEAFGLSHIGNVREENQDAIHLCDPTDDLTSAHGYLYAIADGMGGYAHGGVASLLALTTFCETFYGGHETSIPQKLKLGVQTANIGVYQEARRLQAGRMGTTLTAVLIQGDTLHAAHVGDSRAYLIRDGKSKCFTNDHTRVGELVRLKILTPDKVRTHSQRSMLNKSIGLDLFIQPDLIRLTVEQGDIILLCSDGVWSVIEDDDFAELSSGEPTAEELCHRIIDAAMERESDDNLSVVALLLHEVTHQGLRPSPKNIFRRLPSVLRRIAGFRDGE